MSVIVQDRRWRSPYGIKEPGTPPRPSPWFIRVLDLVSTKSGQLLQRYRATNSSGQLPASGNEYADKLQAQWHRPTQPNAGPIGQPVQQPTLMAAWPTTLGSRSAPSSRVFRMDQRPQLVGHLAPAFLPGNLLQPDQAEPYTLFKGQYHPGQYRRDYLPVRVNDTVPPLRIARPHRAGLQLMAGSKQFGTRQTWGQGEQSLVIAPPSFTRSVTQGVRSLAGVLQQRPGTGRERIPAVFTPSVIQ